MTGGHWTEVALWQLANSAARATVLLLLACGAALLLRRSAAALRHRLWAGVLVTLLLLPAAALLPAWGVAVLPAWAPVPEADDPGPVLEVEDDRRPGAFMMVPAGKQGSYWIHVGPDPARRRVGMSAAPPAPPPVAAPVFRTGPAV